MTTNVPATNTLRPGLLVALSTSIRGNTTYQRKDLDTGEIIQPGDKRHVSRWETIRTVADKTEQEAAEKARSAARTIISKVCVQTAFGLLCLEENAPDLEAAIVEARKVVDAFNDSAKLSRFRFFVVTGRVARDDEQAVKAISAEIRDLINEMEEGVQNLDVKRIRANADTLKQVSGALSLEAQARVELAIEAARKQARKMAAAGEQAAAEIDRATINRLKEVRNSFLDVDAARELQSPVTQARALDLTPTESETASTPPQARTVEVG